MNEKKIGRPHHRTTIITTTKKAFERVRNLKEGQEIIIECPNDVISSCSGGSSVIHHSIRRVSLLRRQVAGNFRRVKVRYEQGNEVICSLTGRITGDIDGCSFKVGVKR